MVPSECRQDILKLAHEHSWSSHLGVTKTYDRVLQHFFWPGLKGDVARFCRSCSTCQVVGNPNQVVPLKSYHSREAAMGEQVKTPETAVPEVLASLACATSVCNDDLGLPSAGQQCGRLLNSELLPDMNSRLPHLSNQQRDDIITLLHSYPSLFGDVPSRTTVLEHDTDVGNSKPIKQHAYRCPMDKREKMKGEVKYLLHNGLAEPSKSLWSSPRLLAPKTDGTPRFCTDFRKVNEVTVPDSFPLPRMEDCIDTIGDAVYITKLDLLKGYWQVPLTPRAREISASVFTLMMWLCIPSSGGITSLPCALSSSV